MARSRWFAARCQRNGIRTSVLPRDRSGGGGQVDAVVSRAGFMTEGPHLALLREPLLDAQQAAVLLGIPRSSVYAYAKRGELPFVKIGRHVKFVRSDLEQALVERRVGI